VQNGGFGGKIGEGWYNVDPNELVPTFGGCYLFATFGENRSRKCDRESVDGQTNTL